MSAWMRASSRWSLPISRMNSFTASGVWGMGWAGAGRLARLGLAMGRLLVSVGDDALEGILDGLESARRRFRPPGLGRGGSGGRRDGRSGWRGRGGRGHATHRGAAGELVFPGTIGLHRRAGGIAR